MWFTIARFKAVERKAELSQNALQQLPESLCVKVYATIAFIAHLVADDSLDVLNNFRHVFADSGHYIWPSAVQSIHILKELSFILSSMLPEAYIDAHHC